MARKPETALIEAVNKQLDPSVYYEKTSNPYRGGTPDVYYEGPGNYLWVEYKYSPTLPPTICLACEKPKVRLSDLQQRWLNRAFRNNSKVAVIYGWGSGRSRRAVYLDQGKWMREFTREEFENKALPMSLIAAKIHQQVTRR